MSSDMRPTSPADALDGAAFREAMACFPSGVVVATTLDGDGQPRGFTASAFCSVSAAPPLVLVCLARDADCHAAFSCAPRWAISVLHSEQRELAIRFATKGAQKFAGQQLDVNAHGIPVPRDAVARLDCTPHAAHDAGDHTVLIAHVQAVTVREGAPMVYYQRGFHRIGAAASAA